MKLGRLVAAACSFPLHASAKRAVRIKLAPGPKLKGVSIILLPEDVLLPKAVNAARGAT